MSGASRPVCPKFISLEDGENTTTSSEYGFRFRLVSYNILAQVYVRSSYFPHSPSACLRWKARSQAILTDLKNFNADFLCIQELDEFDSFYKSKMESHGYASVYIQRSGQKSDGCGIFYKLSSAELVLKTEIEYNDLVNSIDGESSLSVDKNDDALDIRTTKDTSKAELPEKGSLGDRGDPSDPRVRLKRDCVGVLAAFKLKDPSHHLLIVANTHIYWDPNWADVKLAQANYLLSRLTQFKKLVSDKYSCVPSVIVAGDFNSTPGDEVYRYLLSSDHIRLCSLYATNGGEPPFTNCTPGFTGTIDYIFLSDTDHLRPVSLLEIPGPESPDVIGGLPNFHHPSDHLPIGGEFEVPRSSESGAIPSLHEVNANLKSIGI